MNQIPRNVPTCVQAEDFESKLQLMQNHHVFAKVTNIAKLKIFMEWHVFAVWDFMSLVKRLQRDFTCWRTPWLPPANIRAARMINEIVLGEETDEAPANRHDSHFGLYLGAMREVGASTERIDNFIDLVRAGASVDTALDSVGAPGAIRDFVLSTISTAETAATHEVLGNFFYGREHSIPKMFSSLLRKWGVDPAAAPTFVYYIARHIQLDGDSHGPAALAVIEEIVGSDIARMAELEAAASAAVERRLGLWDALAEVL